MKTTLSIIIGILMVTFLCGAGLASTDQQAAQAPSPQTPFKASSQQPPQVTRLPNGLTVVVKKDDRFPLVSLRLYVHAGSAYERETEAGISHVLEHMVFKGTEKRPKSGVASDVESTGGYLNAATSFDYTVYLTDMTKDHWKEGMDVLKDMAFHPSLDPGELESEKEVIVSELKRGEDTPSRRIFRMIQQICLKGTPYYNPIIGYESTVRSLTVERIRNYIAAHYQPQSMMLLICGQVDEQEALAEAVRLFGDLKNTRSVEAPVAGMPKPAGFTAIAEQGPWKKVQLALAFPVAGLNDATSPQLDLLAQLLGGDAASRFYHAYKYEKRLVDSISVGNYSFERLGMFFIHATLDAEKLPAFWATFMRDLAGLRDATFSREELARARLNIEDELYRSKETIAGEAEKLGFFQFFGQGEQGEANYLAGLNNTGQSELTELIARTFRPEALSMAVLLPEDPEIVRKTNLPAVVVTGKAPEKAGEAVTDAGGKGAADAAGAKTVTPEAFTAWAKEALAAYWPSPAPAESVSASADTGTTEVLELGQGRTLILLPDATLPYTAVNLMFSGGDSLLSKKDQGLGAFTASLLTKGTQTLNAEAMEEYQSDRAAYFAASSGRQSFSFSMECPSRFNADMFSLLRDVLIEPAMQEKEAERVRENLIAAVTQREDQAMGLAFRRMFPFFFKDHPYGWLNQGESSRIAEFTVQDARGFWKEQLRRPWVLAVCGDFDREAVLRAAKRLPKPSEKEISLNAPEWNHRHDLELHLKDRNQAHLFMAFPTVGYGHADEPGLELLQNILAGQSGLLFRDLRDEQGLGYSVTAFSWKTQKTGLLIFYIGTAPDKLQVSEEGFRKVIASLQAEALPENELARGKNQMTGDYYRGRQKLASRSVEAASLTLLHYPLEASEILVKKAQSVVPADLQTLAQTYLQPDKAYMITVVP